MKKAALLFSVLFLAAAAATADTQFRVRQMTRNDVPFGKGQCDIRLQVDGEAEVSVRGDSVFIHTISGREPRDVGSECNAPLPQGDLRGFNFEVKDSRGQIGLVAEPSRRSGGRAIVRIRDSKGGEGRYHFRLSWEMGGAYEAPRREYGRPAGPPERDFGFDEAMRVCQGAVVERIANDYRMRDVDFENVRADDRPGRNDWIVGEAFGRRDGRGERFVFDCSVDFRSGRVRSVEVRRR